MTHAFGRTPLDEETARRTDLYLITHKPLTTESPVPPAAFEPKIPVRGE